MALFGGKKADLNDPREVWEEFFKAALKNDWAKSLGFLESLKRLEPANPQVHMKAGDVLQRLGKTDESVSSYHKAASMLDGAEEPTKALATYKIILRLNAGDEKAAARSRDIIGNLRSARAQAPQAPSAGEAAPSEANVSTSYQKAAAPAGAKAGKPKGKPKDLREAFARHPVFSVLTDDEIKFMSQKAGHLSFKDGDVVIEEDTQGDSIYVIKKGRAGVTTSVEGQTLELASLGGLGFFGEGGFLTGAPRTATVTAKGQLELMEIPKALMSDMIIQNPQLLGRLVELLRARASNSQAKTGGA
jgi:hypothetical protein